MDRKRRSKRLLTYLVLCCVSLTSFLDLSCSNLVSAQNSTVVAPLRGERSWIVGHTVNATVTQSVVPGCTELCLNALNPVNAQTLVGLPVQMYPCQDSDNSLFQYNDSSNSITMWDPVSYVNRCLDAGQFPSNRSDSGFTLEECNTNATNQQWYFQADGQIRSGLVNSSSAVQSTQPLFMQGKSRRPEDWGTGLNTFLVYLSSEGNSNTMSSFSMLTYASPPPVSQPTVAPAPNPSNGTVDWIINGDFERCGYDLGQNTLEDFSSNTWWFTICSWAITSGSVQLVDSGFWQDDHNIGNVTLHLNGYGGPGAIMQLISADAGSNYSLSFDVAGDPPYCGSNNKTLNVSVSPSSLPWIPLSLNVTDKSPATIEWMSYVLNFTAYGTSLNFTFQSTTNGGCGPLIDNVVLRKFPDLKAGSNSGLSKVLKVTIAVLAVGLVIPTLLCGYWIWRKRNRGHVDTLFVHGIRGQSDMDALDARFKSGSSSFSSMYGNQYTWEELERATNNFAKVLGNGSSGLLYVAEFPDGLFGVVKVDAHQRQWTSDEAFRQEVAILQRLHHAYLVNFIGVCVGRGSQRAIVFEYMPNGNLFDRLHKLQDNPPLSWQIRMVIAYQVACALEYLHEEASPPIVHRNVQASNVLLQRDDSAKLAAFEVSKAGRSGLGGSFESTSAASPVKKGYLDRTGRTSKKSDVYSYGALLLELITGLPAAELDLILCADVLTNTEEMINIVDPKLLGKFNKHELIEVIDIAVKCLKPEGKSRPSMSDVVFMLRAGFSSSRPLMYG